MSYYFLWFLMISYHILLLLVMYYCWLLLIIQYSLFLLLFIVIYVAGVEWGAWLIEELILFIIIMNYYYYYYLLLSLLSFIIDYFELLFIIIYYYLWLVMMMDDDGRWKGKNKIDKYKKSCRGCSGEHQGGYEWPYKNWIATKLTYFSFCRNSVVWVWIDSQWPN